MDTITVVALVVLSPASFACLYYLGLTLIGWYWPRRLALQAPRHHVTVLIPAHNEAGTITDAIASVFASDYPAEKLRVVVVADNCSDGTATVARGLGADCLERFSDAERGKGYALAFGIARVLATSTDVVMVVDADCEVNRDTIRLLDAAITQGANVAQAAVTTRNPDVQPSGLIAGVGGELENGVSSGLDRLGLLVSLRGTGMAFRRAVLEECPWDAFGLTEDAQYTGRLRRAKLRVRFVLGAEVRSEAPPTVAAFRGQRQRWRSALFTGGTSPLHRLLGSKPLVLFQLALTVIAVGILSAWLPAGGQALVWLWAAGLVVLTAVPYALAIRRGRYDTGGFVGVSRSVALTGRLTFVTLAGMLRRDSGWQRTQRVAETSAAAR